MKAWLRINVDELSLGLGDSVTLEDESGGELTNPDLAVEYDGTFALIGPIEVAEGEE